MAKLSPWLLSMLQRSPTRTTDDDFLREAAESFRAETDILSLEKFDGVLFDFAMEAGFVSQDSQSVRQAWRDAVTAAVDAYSRRYTDHPGTPDHCGGLYMFWENLLGLRNDYSATPEDTAQFMEDLLTSQLRDGNQILKLAAVQGLKHLGPDVAARAISAAGIDVGRDDMVAVLAREAM